MEVTIEKGVPLTSRGGNGRQPKWPVVELDVGDSFSLPSEKADSVRTTCQKVKRETGRVFAVRFDFDESNKTGEKRHRCWRIA